MNESKKTIAWSLGAFVGHIVKGVKTPVSPARVEVGRETQTRSVQTPMGMVTARRTVIDELEVSAARPSVPGPENSPGQEPFR